MKHNTLKLVAVIAIFTTITFTACIKDIGKRSYKIYSPVIEKTSDVRSKVKSIMPQAVVNAGKLFVMGNYVFLNEKNKGIHIIDNTNPSNPINVSFINVPGCYDIAVTGNILYADCFADLLAIDISNPTNVVLKNYIDDIFSDRRIINYSVVVPTGSVVTDWTSKDTTVDIEIGEGQGIWIGTKYLSDVNTVYTGGPVGLSSASSSTTGKAGSMSRFAIVNHYLYAVSNSTLHSVNISNAQQPIDEAKQNIGWNIETIYPFKDKLFIGSQTGMMMYSLTNASQPVFISSFSHARLCDPVIADDNYAYITLHASESICVGTQNELDIVDITNLSQPNLITRFNLTKPQGLSKEGNLLFVCDDDAGVKVINVTNAANPVVVQTLPLAASYDVICNNGIALVSAKDGLHQYNYSNPNNIVKLSKFSFY